MIKFRRAGQKVPPIYGHHSVILEALLLEYKLLKLGYPYDVARAMPLPEARLKSTVLGMVYG